MQKIASHHIFSKIVLSLSFSFCSSLLLGYDRIQLSSSDTSIIQTLERISSQKSNITSSIEQTQHKNFEEQTKQATEQYEWTLMFYVQAKNNLYSAIVDNFHEITQTFNSDKVAIYLQWYQPNHEGIKRYRITHNNLHLEYSSDDFHPNHKSEELVDFAQWCMEKAPAKRYACILSNHGLGIIDPEWGNSIKTIKNPMSIAHSQRTEIEDLVDTFHFDTFSEENRGILFDETRRVYMNNQELIKGFEGIKKLRHGRKLDLIGMDACYMQMVEIADILSPYGDYFVASQDVELARGWGYAGVMRSLCSKPDSSAREFAQYIINAYDALYRGKTNLFTQSALHLSSVDQVKYKTHELANVLLKLYDTNAYETKNIIRQARNRCQQFSMQTYIDLKSFCQELQKLIAPKKSEYSSLHTAINGTLSAINQCIIANTSSTYFNRAFGLSIYFPLYRIDKSYLDTPFARNSSWLEFLYKSLLM